VPQQHAWVLERLGRYHATLTPGLTVVVPFIDRVAYKHILKEIPLDVPSQVCITKDNTQLQVDGVLYFQVTDPMKASYGSSNFVVAITQLSQTTLRSVIGKLELDKTFEEREFINHSVVNALDEAAANWGVKVLRYEIKDLTPPKEILHAMQAQITAEREKRADRGIGRQAAGADQPGVRCARGGDPEVRGREAGGHQQGARRGVRDSGRGRGKCAGDRENRSCDPGRGRFRGSQPQGRGGVCGGVWQPGQAGQHIDRAGQPWRDEFDDRVRAAD
jgi:hypothetical protein